MWLRENSWFHFSSPSVPLSGVFLDKFPDCLLDHYSFAEPCLPRSDYAWLVFSPYSPTYHISMQRSNAVIIWFIFSLSANANKIWLCCSTHNLGQLFVLDIVNGSLEFVKGSVRTYDITIHYKWSCLGFKNPIMLISCICASVFTFESS